MKFYSPAETMSLWTLWCFIKTNAYNENENICVFKIVFPVRSYFGISTLKDDQIINAWKHLPQTKLRTHPNPIHLNSNYSNLLILCWSQQLVLWCWVFLRSPVASELWFFPSYQVPVKQSWVPCHLKIVIFSRVKADPEMFSQL